MDAVQVVYRDSAAGDLEAIARLHAESWRRNYRGAYSDEFLDGEVFTDRLAVWTDRLTHAQPNQCTIVAECEGVVVGLAHTILDDHPKWGALLDNLHVTHDLKGQGVGTRLMAETARVVIEQAPSTGLYLWVLEQNKAAQAFYEARGGICVGRASSEAPGGGNVVGLRYAWTDPCQMLVRKRPQMSTELK